MVGKSPQQPVSLACERIGPLPLIARTAALPVARNRCDHFTTFDTLTLKVAATARQL